MTSALPRLILAATIASLLLIGCVLMGCAHQQPAAQAANPKPAASAAATPKPASSVRSTHHRQQPTAKLPDKTGIAACDDYLSSYIACHRAAGIFTPDQLPLRYQEMRTSLLRDSLNPDMRPRLAARCNSLANQLREALHGKSCAMNPAPASSTP